MSDEIEALRAAIEDLDRSTRRVVASAVLCVMAWFGTAFCLAVDVWLARFGIGAQIAFGPVLFAATLGAMALTLGDR